jgi:toxin ParE1/3/4
MKGRVHRRIQAKFDLINHAVYLVTESSPETADRFVDAAESAFTQLAGQPQMGWQRTFRNHRLSSICVWRVKGFTDYLIFYLPLDDGVDIIRVLHGKRDLENVLEDELIKGLEDEPNGEAL